MLTIILNIGKKSSIFLSDYSLMKKCFLKYFDLVCVEWFLCSFAFASHFEW